MNFFLNFSFLLILINSSSSSEDNPQDQLKKELDNECNALFQEKFERFSEKHISLKQALEDIQESVKKGKENQDQIYNEMNDVSNELEQVINRLEKDSEADVSKEIKLIRETVTKIEIQSYMSEFRYNYALMWVRAVPPFLGEDGQGMTDLFSVRLMLAGQNTNLSIGVYLVKKCAEQIENYKNEDLDEVLFQLKVEIDKYDFKSQIDKALTLIQGFIDRIEEKEQKEQAVDQVVE